VDGRVSDDAVAEESGVSKRVRVRYLELEEEHLADKLVLLISALMVTCNGFSDSPAVIVTVIGFNDAGARRGGSDCPRWVGCDIREEGTKVLGKGEVREKKHPGWVNTSRGLVCGVVSAGDVPCVYLVEVIGHKEELVDAPKYVVGFCISVSAIPPPLDDSCIVAVDEDTRV
jgi:hypothetical protein